MGGFPKRRALMFEATFSHPWAISGAGWRLHTVADAHWQQAANRVNARPAAGIKSMHIIVLL